MTRTPARLSELLAASARFLVFGILFALAGWISIRFTRQPGTASTIWVASGLLAGVLLNSPRRLWPGYLLVAFAASLITRTAQGDAWFSILGLSFASVMEAGVVSFVLAHYVSDWNNPGNIKRVGLVSFGSNLCASALSALLVATILASFGTASFITVLGTWFASHTLGMAIFGTLTWVALQRGRQLFGKPGHRLEFGLMLALIATVCLGVFSQSRSLLFLIYPPLMLCVFRHRLDGAVLGIAVVVVISTAETLAGNGPLFLSPGSGATERTLLLQLFIAVTCLLSFPVAVVLTEANLLTRGLRESERRHRVLAQELEQRNVDLESSNEKLAGAQTQLLQSEKMASVGQLAAGVAHEINNPIGYVRSNLTSLTQYWQSINAVLEGYERLEAGLPSVPPEWKAVQMLKQRVELDYLRKDIVNLLAESVEGVTRVEKIVRDLRDFSHVDQAEWMQADIHECIDSTLNVVWHEIKYKGEVVKQYGDLPLIQCLPFQLKQVFMNLLVNAAQAIERRGIITIRTEREHDNILISFTDTGKGIEPAHLKRIFEPFFTAKSVGVGTGLGLSVSYGIIQKHGGTIEVASEVGKGTTFTIRLPTLH